MGSGVSGVAVGRGSKQGRERALVARVRKDFGITSRETSIKKSTAILLQRAFVTCPVLFLATEAIGACADCNQSKRIIKDIAQLV